MGINEETLFFPVEIAHAIGLPGTAINAMKSRGCRFYGRKTTIRWVREFIERETAEIPPIHEQAADVQHQSAHK